MQAHTAAQKTEEKKADFGAFVTAYGGPTCKRKRGLLQLHKVWSDEPNKYQEPKGYAPRGLVAIGGLVDKGGIVGKIWSRAVSAIVESNRDVWVVVKRGFEGAPRSGVTPWTRVNNCTQDSEGRDDFQKPRSAVPADFQPIRREKRDG